MLYAVQMAKPEMAKLKMAEPFLVLPLQEDSRDDRHSQ